MRVGIIDCGTNTFNLLIAEVSADGWSGIFVGKISVRLGKGGLAQGLIRPERLARGLDALCVHRETMINYDVEECIVLATAAVREASNAHDFIRRTRELTGLEMMVIDGMREADLIYCGVAQTIDLTEEYITVMDIGGGSTEFIIANAEGVAWKQSFPLGVARIQEYLNPDETLSPEDTERLLASFASVLAPLREALQSYPSAKLVGASGSFDTLVSMYHSSGDQPKRKKHEANAIPLDAFNTLHQQLLQSSLEERLAMPGMLPMRAETMHLATLLIDFVLKSARFEHLCQSNYALKEGALERARAGKLKLQVLRSLHDQNA
jgi:exopolyphosphatase/guanosine-5'-triphosphate,3'-diphosphate pyrophosphatase